MKLFKRNPEKRLYKKLCRKGHKDLNLRNWLETNWTNKNVQLVIKANYIASYKTAAIIAQVFGEIEFTTSDILSEYSVENAIMGNNISSLLFVTLALVKKGEVELHLAKGAIQKINEEIGTRFYL